MSCCLCALELWVDLWDNIRFTQVLLESSSAGPALPQSACICLGVYSLSSLGATWSAHHFWLGPVQTWGLGTESSRRSWSKVPRLGKTKSVWRTSRLLPRRSLRCCPPTLPEADPPAGLYAGPPAWRSPGEAAAARSSAAGSSAPGTGYLEDLHGASCPHLQWTFRFAHKEKLKGEISF